MNNHGRTLGIIVGAFVFLSVATAYAAPVRFNFRFENSDQSVTATGFIVFESTLIPNPSSCGGPIALPNPLVLDLGITVSGLNPPAGGVFELADFDRVAFCTADGTLDLSSQLVGQSIAGGIWGQSRGDFNLFDAVGGDTAPNGEEIFFLCPANGNFDSCMNLVSMAPAVTETAPAPTLSSAGLACAALMLLALAVRSLSRVEPQA